MKTEETMNTKAAPEGPVIDLIRNTVRSQAPDAEIILYGSRARGDARPDSDWDVLVLVDKQAQRLILDEKSSIDYSLWLNGAKMGEEINTFAYTKQQWNNMPMTLFKRNVTKEGIRQ